MADKQEFSYPIAGETLAHYKVVERLASGGMGEIYIAEDTKLGRRVALKILPAEAVADAERLQRFQSEARAIAAMNHPNIVAIVKSLPHLDLFANDLFGGFEQLRIIDVDLSKGSLK